jgi:hypothetical protein
MVWPRRGSAIDRTWRISCGQGAKTSAQCRNGQAGQPAAHSLARGEARMVRTRLQICDESIEVQRFGRLLGTVIQRDIPGLQALRTMVMQ